MTGLRREALGADEFGRTHAALAAGIAEGVAPGFALGIWRRERPDEIRGVALGERRREPSSQPMQIDTVFDLASLTKVIATATLAGHLVDRGWIEWRTPLRALLPEFAHPEVELRHLLSHTAGLTWWLPLWEGLRAKFGPDPGRLARTPIEARQAFVRAQITQAPLEARPGERAVYSDLSFMLLGFALEAALQMPLDRAVRELVWRPLGLRGLRYYRVDRGVEAGRRDECAATERCSWRGGVLQGQVHDDNAWAMGGYAGHAGAFGALEDVLRFARALMSGEFLSRDTLNAQWTRFAGFDRTLGWDARGGESPSSGRHFSMASVGHLGFTGTSLWVDPPAGVAVVLLSNRVHPTRDNPLIRAFRPRLHDALREDLAQFGRAIS